MIYAFADDEPGTSAIKRALAATPDSQDDALLNPISTNEGEKAGDSAEGEEEDGDEDEGEGDEAKRDRGVDLADKDEGHC